MIDLTTVIGGRTVSPALPIVDGSSPTPSELAFQSTLDAYVASHVPTESDDGIRTRERVLVKMGRLHREWVRGVAIKRGLNSDAVEAAGGELFTSGSYRLGVHEPGADIGECAIEGMEGCSVPINHLACLKYKVDGWISLCPLCVCAFPYFRL
jgi:poly(A) polymerase